MTQLDIFGKALAAYNIKISELSTEETEDHPMSPQVWICHEFWENVELSCAEIYDWSFLYAVRKYEDKDLNEELSYNGRYAYPVPEGFATAIFVNDEYNANVRRIGRYLVFTERNPILTYVDYRIDFNDWRYPNDYGYLLAYKLAMEIFPNVATDSAMYQGVVNKYGLVIQQLRNAEIKLKRKKNPSPFVFVP